MPFGEGGGRGPGMVVRNSDKGDGGEEGRRGGDWREIPVGGGHIMSGLYFKMFLGISRGKEVFPLF